jgi:hypothetical protein
MLIVSERNILNIFLVFYLKIFLIISNFIKYFFDIFYSIYSEEIIFFGKNHEKFAVYRKFEVQMVDSWGILKSVRIDKLDGAQFFLGLDEPQGASLDIFPEDVFKAVNHLLFAGLHEMGMDFVLIIGWNHIIDDLNKVTGVSWKPSRGLDVETRDSE